VYFKSYENFLKTSNVLNIYCLVYGILLLFSVIDYKFVISWVWEELLWFLCYGLECMCFVMCNAVCVTLDDLQMPALLLPNA